MFFFGRKKKVGGETLIFEKRIVSIELRSGIILGIGQDVIVGPNDYNENIIAGDKGKIVGFEHFPEGDLGIVAYVDFRSKGRAPVSIYNFQLPFMGAISV